MQRRIWIPEGMYRGLPWIAAIAGFVGIMVGCGRLGETMALGLLCYGVGVLTVRAASRGGAL